MPRARRVKPLISGMTEAQVLAGTLEALQLYGIDPERRNTGAGVNPRGQVVRFGRPGDSDITAILPRSFGPAAGRRLDIECKREGFRPERLRGEKRAHWERQKARLKATCEAGGYGFWCDKPETVVYVLERIKQGWRIVWEGDGQFLTDEG